MALGSRWNQHKTKNITITNEIVLVAIVFAISLQWVTENVQRMTFDPGGQVKMALAKGISGRS